MEHQEINTTIKKIEFILGYTLPQKFIEFYLNGDRFINNIEFLDINSIYNELCQTENDDIEEEYFEVEPEYSILKRTYDKKRLPIIEDGTGNYIGIDFNPGPNGIIGQIINYGTDEYTMKVLANNFEDFINGLKQIKISTDIYVGYYLLEKNLNFRKDIIYNDIKEISTNITQTQKIDAENKNEVILEKSLNSKNVIELIDILSTLDYKLRNDINIKKYINIWFDHRIINKKDSLSRTMPTTKDFYQKLSTYNKEEIKGYSFSIFNKIEETRDNQLYIGEERIFVEINLLKNQILIRYTETIKNQIMFNVYNKLIEYIKGI